MSALREQQGGAGVPEVMEAYVREPCASEQRFEGAIAKVGRQERAQVGELAEQVQRATDESVEIAFVDQDYTGDRPAEEAKAHSMRLEVVKHEGAKRGFVLLPRRWVVERDFA